MTASRERTAVPFSEIRDRLGERHAPAEVALAELEADPNPVLRRLREESPVAVCTELEALLALRWADVQTVVSTAELFRSDQPDSYLTRFVGPNMLHSEGQEHRAARSAMLPAFRAADPRMPAEVAGRYAELRGSYADGTPCDLAAEFCVPLVARATIDLLGCEDTVTPAQMDRWGPLVSEGAFDFREFGTPRDDVDGVRAEILSMVAEYVAGRRRARPDTVLGCMAKASSSQDETRRMVEFMIIGADAGPREGLSTVLACVLTADGEMRRRLAASPALRQSFVDEALRWESPIGGITREARVGTELSGVAIEAGTRVIGVLPSANRDPRRWPDGDAFVPDRGDRAHLSFGAGAHGCIGAALSRRLADAMVLAVASDPAVRPYAVPEYRGWWYRGPSAVLASWN
ncbi:cytochrome P450 [Streptomyces sp. CMB-StM0423]|uniref:cytochrome P450 n=1 Tax=Streptomyces sp. CMB-StM0423 TaxID=2059884 RepID=UPI00131E6EA0|nr:cytochrome P450 [Streptomyces sp. CMB-StM0423]